MLAKYLLFNDFRFGFEPTREVSPAIKDLQLLVAKEVDNSLTPIACMSSRAVLVTIS